MKRRDFIKRSGLSTLGAWAASSSILSACHTEEDMMGEPNWIVDGSFDRLQVSVMKAGVDIRSMAKHFKWKEWTKL